MGPKQGKPEQGVVSTRCSSKLFTAYCLQLHDSSSTSYVVCVPLLQFQGSHGALGDRARKLKSEGILVIRFEVGAN